MALLEQKDGEESMISLLNQLALFQGEAENALREHFPQLNRGTNGTRVAWLLQLATMSVPKLSDVMSILETEQKLTEALTFSVVVNEEVVELTIDDFETIATLEEQQRQILLDKVKRNLITIERRCFPFFREMLASYGRILVTLSKGETTEVATLVAGLKKERQLQKNAATQARDYMDWFEINQSNDVVGEYQRLLGTNKVKLEKDQLSEYVETLDNLFEN